jgi:hypothetical protein
VVDTTNDSNATAYQDCTGTGNDCSLREAISKVICSSAITYNHEVSNYWLPYSSITIGTDGLALISYIDYLNLKVSHLANIFGIPFLQRR